MIGALIFIAVFAGLPALGLYLTFSNKLMVAFAWFMRSILRRKSLATPIAKCLLSPISSNDWEFSGGDRMDADNVKIGLRVWGYKFSNETHLFRGRDEIVLKAWERATINAALRKRNRAALRDSHFAECQQRNAMLADAAHAIIREYEDAPPTRQ